MGNNDRTKVVIVLLAIVLAAGWRRRGWWIPVVALSATYLGERFTQQVLKDVVHRGHPPTTLGSYPSGGCGRMISVWGVALLLTLLLRPHSSHRSRAVIWMALALAAYSQGYSRTYLLKHWLTDVIGGWLFGAAVLAVFGVATVVMVRGQDRRTGHGTSSSTDSDDSNLSSSVRTTLPSL